MYAVAMKKETLTVFIKNFPRGLWEHFRALCLIESKTVLEKLVEVLTKETEHLK